MRKVKNEEDVIDHFWKRWHREYLVDLREHQKLHKQRACPDITEGDVVLVGEDGAKRNTWRLGRIEEIIRGRDLVIRGANVLTAKGGCKGKVSRPLPKPYPLEVKSEKILPIPNVESNGTIPYSNHKGKLSEAKGCSDSKKCNSIDYISYGKSSNTRPKRVAGVTGEATRRIFQQE